MMGSFLYFNIVIPLLQHLPPANQELIYKAPLLVCLLIAGADGIIDRRVIKRALRAVLKKSHDLHKEVSEFFKEVGTDFKDKLQVLLQAYPNQVTRQNELIVKELSILNEVFLRHDRSFSVELYRRGLFLLAEAVAKASGVFLSIGKVGKAGRPYLKLPMLKDPGLN